MKTAEEIWDKHFNEWVIAGQIKRNAIPAMIEYAEEVVKNNLVKPDVSGRSELLLSFFLWFRENGELYVDKPIEEMIAIYEKESNSH